MHPHATSGANSKGRITYYTYYNDSTFSILFVDLHHFVELDSQLVGDRDRDEYAGYLSYKFAKVHHYLTDLGANEITSDDQLVDGTFAVPHLDNIFNCRIDQLSRTTERAMKQEKVTDFLEDHNLDFQTARNLREQSEPDRLRIQHISAREVKNHGRKFDIDPEAIITHAPMAMFGRINPTLQHGLNKYQAGYAISLLTGTKVPTSQDTCPCQTPFNDCGSHALTCPRWAGRGWIRGHDQVVEQVAWEHRHVGLPCSASKAVLQKSFTHENSKAHADGYVKTDGLIKIKTRQPDPRDHNSERSE